MTFTVSGSHHIFSGTMRGFMETRRYVQGAELRASAGSNSLTITARACKYNALSLRGVPAPNAYERIAAGAFRASIASGQEVFCLLNHSMSSPLGRQKNGTLSLRDEADGLYFSVKLDPNVSAHRDVHALVANGTYDSCSFAFSCDDDNWTNEKVDGQTSTVRTVRAAKLMDVSLVLTPAYSDGATNATARNISYRFAPASAEPVRKLNVERCFLSPVEMLSNRSRAKMLAVRIRIDNRIEEERQLMTDFSPAGKRRFAEYVEERFQDGQAADPQQTMRCRGGSLSASPEDHAAACISHRILGGKAKTMEEGCRHFAAADMHELAAVSSNRANDALVACRAAMQPSAVGLNKA
jgi:HK97 family phage prohead protease